MFFRCCLASLNRRTPCTKNLSTSQWCSGQHEQIVEQRSRELCRLLGCSPSTAQLIIRRNSKITHVSSEEFLDNVKFCKSSFRFKDIVEFPVILTLPHEVLSQRYQTLKEFGCHRVRPNYILNYMLLMNETPSTLRKHGIFFHTKDALQDVLDRLEISEEEKQQLRTKLSSMFARNSQLFSIKTKLTSEFVMWRTQQKKSMTRLVLRNPVLLCDSIDAIESRIRILTETIGFSLKEICAKSFMIGIHLDQLKEYMSMPNVVGVPVRELVKKCPELLRKSPRLLQMNSAILSNYRITEDQLRLVPKVLLLNPSILEHHLNVLLNSKDISPLKSDKGFLKLVWFNKKVHKRIELIKQASLPYSVLLLTISDSAFNRKCKTPTQSHVHAEEVVDHLSDMYKCSAEKIRYVLNHYPRPCTSIVNAYSVIQFLLSRDVSKAQLWNGLGIIAYDVQVVQECFDQLPSLPELQPFSDSVRHFNFVQFLVYTVDRCINNSAIYSTEAQPASQNQISQTFQPVEVDECHAERYFNEDGLSDSLSESELYSLSDDDEEIEFSDEEADAYVV